MENKTISNFWAAVIASIIFTATALLLDDSEHTGKVIILEGLAFGLRLGDQVLKTYNEGEVEKLNTKIRLENSKLEKK